MSTFAHVKKLLMTQLNYIYIFWMHIVTLLQGS